MSTAQDLDLMLKLQRIIYANPTRHAKLLVVMEKVIAANDESSDSLEIVEPVLKSGLQFKPQWCVNTKDIFAYSVVDLIEDLESQGYNLPSQTDITAEFKSCDYVGVNANGNILFYNTPQSYKAITSWEGTNIYSRHWIQQYLTGE